MPGRGAHPLVVSVLGAVIWVVRHDIVGVVVGVVARHHTSSEPQVLALVVGEWTVSALVSFNPFFSTPVTPVMPPHLSGCVTHCWVGAPPIGLEQAWSVGRAREEWCQSGFGPCLLQAGVDFVLFLLDFVLCVVVSLSLFSEGGLLEPQLLFPASKSSFLSLKLDEAEVFHGNSSVRQGAQGSEKCTVQHCILTVDVFFTLVVKGVALFFFWC